MRIRIINPNTTVSMTETIGAAARAVAAPGTEIIAVTSDAGPVSIEGHYDEAMSFVGLVDEIRKGEEEGTTAYVIACFGDPGLLEDGPGYRDLAFLAQLDEVHSFLASSGFRKSGLSHIRTGSDTVAADLKEPG